MSILCIVQDQIDDVNKNRHKWTNKFRAGRLGLAVPRCSSESYFQAYLTIKVMILLVHASSTHGRITKQKMQRKEFFI